MDSGDKPPRHQVVDEFLCESERDRLFSGLALGPETSLEPMTSSN